MEEESETQKEPCGHSNCPIFIGDMITKEPARAHKEARTMTDCSLVRRVGLGELKALTTQHSD